MVTAPTRRFPRGVRFRAVAMMMAALLSAGVLSACGGGLSEDEGAGERATVKEGDFKGTSWTISTWPLYIDGDTVSEFDKKYNVTTKYIEDVNDNDDFFGKMQPLLAEGKSGGRSVMVVSGWMAEKMHGLGYLQDIAEDALPNVRKNLVPTLADEGIDPQQKYSVPYQAGMTGLIVNRSEAPDVKSVNDLFDPRYKGKVGLLGEVRDTGPLVLAAMGIDPMKASEDEWMEMIDKLEKAVDSGQIRGFYGNDYASEFASGNLVAGLGWSGDAGMLQKDNPDLEWRMPEQGCVLWTDSFVFPVGSPNPAAGLAFIDYVYEPKNAAQIAEYVEYFTPVKGVKEIIAKSDPEMADNKLMFPTEEFLSSCFPGTVMDEEPDQVVPVDRAWEQMKRG